jgi:TDG/mug DNA glycosylase family protein
MRDLGVPDLIKPDLKILFVGINPGKRSGETGHHFAGKSNRFWRFLAESGLTPEKIDPFRDDRMLELGYGITNIVPRTTAAASELRPEELRQGAERLISVIGECRPKVVGYLGKVVYQYLVKRQRIEWGLQETPVIAGIIDFVAPNPSGLNRIPIPEQVEMYRELKRLVALL